MADDLNRIREMLAYLLDEVARIEAEALRLPQLKADVAAATRVLEVYEGWSRKSTTPQPSARSAVPRELRAHVDGEDVSIRDALREAIRHHTGEFTLRDLKAWIDANHPEWSRAVAASNATLSSALIDVRQQAGLELVKQGAAGVPSIYRRTEHSESPTAQSPLLRNIVALTGVPRSPSMPASDTSSA